MLTIADSGHGVAGSEINHLFDPFYTTKFTGRGLGLAVVMGVVRSHGGAIRVKSMPEGGTTFAILLPLVEQATAPVATPVSMNSALSGCVLVVDDEERVRKVARRLLNAIGLDSVEVDSGQAAIDCVERDGARYAAVLMDVSMPGIDGVEAASQILESHPHTNIILSSGYSTVAFSKALHDKVQYLQKPYRLAQLRDVLQALLDQTTV